MEVITIEHEAFKKLECLIERAAQLPNSDQIMSLSEAAQYLGVDKRWVDTRKKKIGYFQENRVIRLRKSDIDKYIDDRMIRPPKKR